MKAPYKNIGSVFIYFASAAFFLSPAGGIGYSYNYDEYNYEYNDNLNSEDCCNPYYAPCPAPCNYSYPLSCNYDSQPQCDEASEPQCNPPCPNESNFWIRGEALWTKSSNSGLAFGLTENKKTEGGTLFVDHLLYPKSHWEWGYRLEAGGKIINDLWDLNVAYTHLKDRASGSSHNNGSKYSIPIYGVDSEEADELLANIDAHYKLKINYVDFTFGRKFCLDYGVKIKPIFGGRAACIKQQYAINSKVISTDPVIHDFVSLHNKFDGIGFKGGLDALWEIGCGLSFVSNASGSVLFGKHKFHYQEAAEALGITFEKDSFKDFHHGCLYVIDLGLALKWEYGCLYGVWGIFAGYEGHIYLNMNHFTNFNDVLITPTISSGSRSDLYVQGANFGAYFNF